MFFSLQCLSFGILPLRLCMILKLIYEMRNESETGNWREGIREERGMRKERVVEHRRGEREGKRKRMRVRKKIGKKGPVKTKKRSRRKRYY